MTLSSHWVGDVPAQPEAVAVDLSDVSLFTAVTAALVDAYGDPVDLTGASFTLDAATDAVIISWGAVSRFETAGLYSLRLTLTGEDGVTQRLDPERIVVQADDGWHTLNSARNGWTDAPYDDAVLFELLEIAGGQVLTYAPSLALDARIPLDYYKAQLMQARNIWNAVKGNGESIGADGFAIVAKPLDWHVQNLLRPKHGVPVIW